MSVRPKQCWSWDAFILSLLAVSALLSLLPDGFWLVPLDVVAIGFLAAGAVRSATALKKRS
jgi:hypothetical protein